MDSRFKSPKWRDGQKDVTRRKDAIFYANIQKLHLLLNRKIVVSDLLSLLCILLDLQQLI